MVQHKPVYVGKMADTFRRRFRKRDYWKLGFDVSKSAHELREYLDEHGYQYPKSATKDVLRDAVGRCQRDLLSYKSCHTEELRAFCQARGLSIPPKRTTDSHLVRILEQADDDATFPRFLDLPLELRIRIYEFHFSDYDEIAFLYLQPPLTLVPEIREEALPLFYGCVTFRFSLSYISGHHPTKYCFTQNTRRLLHMPADSLAKVKNFQLQWMRFCRISGVTTVLSARASQCNNATKQFTLDGEMDLKKLQEIEETVDTRLQQMGFGKESWELRHSGLETIEYDVNKIFRETL